MKAFIVATIMCVVLSVFAGWMIGAIPNEAQYCSENQQTKQEDCATYNIALIAFWKIGEFLEKASDAITALASVAIALFTWTLYRTTNKLWEAGERQIGVAKDAADAAKRSATVAEETINKLERPYVLPADISRITFAIYKAARIGRVSFKIGNYGKTPAIHHVTSGKFMMLETLSEDAAKGDNIPGGVQLDTWDAPIVIGPGVVVDTDAFTIPEHFPLVKCDDGFVRPKVNIPKQLYLFLSTTYEDPVTGIVRTYHSCWKYNHPGTTLIRWGGKNYNYEAYQT
jgi:hypothetical protein